ncbi:MAG: type II secretion system F family protein [Gemmatimonadales bacterium]|jgi:tight adherence protein B
MFDALPANWLPALLVFLAAGLGVVSIAFLIETGREVKKRSDFKKQLRGVTRENEGIQRKREALFRESGLNEITWLEPVLQHVPQMADLRLLLEQANLQWSAGTFLALTAGMALSLGASIFVLTGSGLYGLVAAAVGSMGPYMYVRRCKRRRIEAFEEAFPEAIDLLARSIRAGHAFNTGMKVVAEEAQEPVRTEFRTVFEEQKFGLPLEESLLGLADRIDLVDIRIFVTAILVQRDVGGNLAEILDKISYTIRERFMIQRQIRVYTAQGRMTGYLLAVLPLIMGVLIYMLNAEYMSILFEEPIGRLLIAGALVLQVIGFFIIRRIVDIEV